MDAVWALINVQLLYAGFMGGLVHALDDEKFSPWRIIRFVITGGLTANFSTQAVLVIFPILTQMQFADVAAAFFIGVSGKRVCLYIEERIFGSLKPFGKDET